MAHLEKYTQADYRKLLMHYERAKDENGNYHKFKNQNIDLSRTSQNYNVADFQTLPQSEFMDKRLSQLKIFKRDDVKYMCDWIVTLPKIMGNDERKFFNAVFKFLSDKYKKENVVSAYVHKDETQPHMHFAFVPVAMDKKKNIEKLCSKDIVSRDDMFKFHEELDDYLTSVFGYSTGVRNGATVEGNKSIDELKRGTAVKELAAVRKEREAAEKRIDELSCPPKIEPVKEKKDTVIITKADLDNVNNGLAKIQLSEKHRQDTDAKIKAVSHEKQMSYFKLWQEYDKLKAEHTVLANENREIKSILRRYDKVFKANPSFLESLVQLEIQMNREQTEAERAAKALKRKLKQAQAELE